MKSIENPGKFANKLIAWYHENKRDLPFRKTKNPYNILLSELMAQQTQMDTLVPYYERFVTRFPTLESLAQADVSEVLKYWEGLGYYNRARYLHETAQTLINEYDGEFPTDLENIKGLKGVGEYTANAVHSIAFNQPSVAVDGNVSRVMTRYLGLYEDIRKNRTRQSIALTLKPAITTSEPTDFTQAMMELGALVCRRDPRCEVCPVKTHCFAYKQNKQADLPIKQKTPTKTEENYTVYVIESNGKFVLEKRPDTGLLANMYEFLQYPSTDDKTDTLKTLYGIARHEWIHLGDLNHVFSHKVWRMRIFYGQTSHAVNNAHDLSTFPYAMATAHRKILTMVKEKSLSP